jgi:hypothetical protein
VTYAFIFAVSIVGLGLFAYLWLAFDEKDEHGADFDNWTA